MRWLSYMATRLACQVILAPVSRCRVLHPERAKISGPCLLVANHISHFDPPVLTAAIRRKIDWMAMNEMFENKFVATWLRSVDTFPVDRFEADRAAVRITLDRLKRGRMVGMFPEGGIRDGQHSILEGAPMQPGIGALAQMSGAPVLPCVLVGSDRFYKHANWVPLRRVPLFIAFGQPMRCEKAGKTARREFEAAVATAFQTIYAEMQQAFGLTAEDLPQPPMRRKGRL